MPLEGTALDALREAIRDPYLNAIHVSILRHQKPLESPSNTSSVCFCQREFLSSGLEHLTAEEQELLASHADLMAQLHRQYWLQCAEPDP